MSSASALHKGNRVLACVLCQHRKIKCDRNTPCANCLKANVTCTPSTPAPARKRRRPNQDLQERLARCEELLKQYAGGTAPGQQSAQASPPSPQTPATTMSQSATLTDVPQSLCASSDPYLKWKPTGKMIKDDGGVRLMDSYLFASVYDELRSMRNIIEAEDLEESSVLGSDDLTPENHADLFFPGDTTNANVEDLQPDPVHVFRLWQLFLDRVNPLTKIIHVPTLQPYVMEAAANVSNVPLNYQALLFSIYAMAAVSMSEIECMQTLGLSRDGALQKFSAGTKIALVRFNFLKNHDMASLQALVLYLYSLQGRFDRHAAWILSGTIVRIAQKMGYHRDGELLGLSPFETEMRRRIWWQILMQDAKNAMISGLSHALLPLHWDTKPPQNVNDADLFPSSTEPVQPREGPTEMAFCLVVCEICKFMTSAEFNSGIPGFEAAVLGHEMNAEKDPNYSNAQSIEKYRALVSQLETSLTIAEQRYIDTSAGKVHAASLVIRPMLVNKLREMLVPMHEQPEWGTEIFTPKDNLFKVVIMNNEHNVAAYEKYASNGFLWFVKLHFQLDVFAVMTGQLCHRPAGTLSDRAWKIIETIYSFHPELSDMTQKQYGHQAHFTIKAWKAREQAFAQAGRPIQTPDFIVRLQETLPTPEPRTSTTTQSTTPSISQHPQQITDLDQFLGSYLDVSALNWDSWDDSTVTGPVGAQIPVTAFGNFGLDNMSSI